MADQKRILIAHNFNYDSYMAISISLAKYLVKKGYNVLFISRAPSFKEPMIHEGVEVIGWPNKKERGWKSFWFFVSVHRKFKPDMVISHFGAVSYTMFISWLLRTPFRVAYYHTLSSMIKLDSTLFNYYFMKSRSIIYSLVTDIIFVSKYACKDFKFFHPIKKPRFNVIHNGIPDRNAVHKEVTKNNDIKHYNYLGRIDRSKGILDLVEAFIKLHDKIPNIKLNISGGGKQSDELKQKIKGIDYIEYLGKIPYEKVDNFLQEAYFNIFPSRFDNLPTVVIESLMNGIPVITSNKGGIPEMVTEGYNGFLFGTHDVESINVAIEKTFNLSEEEYHQMKLNARKKFTEEFEISNNTRNMLQFIEKSLSSLKN